MSRSSGLVASLLGSVALAAAVWWSNQPAQQAEEGGGRPPAMLPVTLAEVVDGEVTPRVVFTGTVTSPARVSLAFEVAGVLSELSAREAQRVEAGQALARLTSADEELAVASARADLELARSELRKLEAGTREQVVARLEADLAEREAMVQLAAVEVARQEKLEQKDIVSRAEFDRARAEHAAAVARKEAARQALEEARAGTRREDIAIAAARVGVEEARLAQAERQLEKTILRAPTDGVVLRRDLAVGAHVTPGQAALEMVDLSQLEIRLEIPSQFALQLGDRPSVQLLLDELPDYSATAVLDAFVPAADEKSRNFSGLIHLAANDEAYAPLKPGMFVRVRLELASAAGRVVPSDAIRTTSDGPIVVAAENAEDGLVARWVPVRVLASGAGRSAVRPLGAELAAGGQVVVTGVDLAYPGASLFTRGAGGADEAPSAAAATGAAASAGSKGSSTEAPPASSSSDESPDGEERP